MTMTTRKWLVGMACAIGIGLAPAALAETLTLKVHHFLPPGSTAHAKFIVPWCEKVQRESGDRIKCQVFPAMQLGGRPPQLFDQARDGIADIVWTLLGYSAGRFPAIEAFELPFMTHSAEGGSRALWEYVQVNRLGDSEFKDVHPILFHVHDEGQLHLVKGPIETLSDFRGLKLRAPTRQTNKFLAALGATPVGMPVPQVAEALSKGVIDGAMLPWEVVPAIKVDEFVKFHSETDAASPALYTAVFAFAMNRARYESLPPDLRKVIDDNGGADASARAGRIWDDSAVAARNKAIERGNQFNTIPESELKNWRKAADWVAKSWVEEVSGKGHDGSALLDSARALLKTHDGN